MSKKKENSNTKRVKVRRADRFKPIKKALVKAYTAPLFLKNMYGITKCYESGIFQVGEKIYNRVYKFDYSSLDNKDDVFDILRSYDFEYRFYYLSDSVYLSVQIKSDNLQDASFDFDAIEKVIFKKLSNRGVKLIPLDIENRFRLVHKLSNKKNINYNPNVQTYVKDVADWKQDFELDNFKDCFNKLELGNGCYVSYYIQKFGNNINELLNELVKLDGVENLVIQHSPVSDNAIYEWFHHNYMGCDNELRHLKKKDTNLYEILTDPSRRDSRSYSMVAINILVYVEDEKNLDNLNSKLNFLISRYDAKINVQVGDMKKVFMDSFLLGKWDKPQTRTVKNNVSRDAFLFFIRNLDSSDDEIDMNLFL